MDPGRRWVTHRQERNRHADSISGGHDMKKMLTANQLDSQSVMELPNRDMLLITVVITNLLNNLSVDVDVRNINVAVQVCAVVEALNTELLSTDSLTCTIQQRN
jgi:hypothetical protein